MASLVGEWLLTRSIYSYCEQCQLFKSGDFWRYFVTGTQSKKCICAECANGLLEEAK